VNARSPISEPMESNPKLSNAAALLKSFVKENCRLPSYSELAKMFGFASKNAAYKLANRLIEAGILQKDPVTGHLKLNNPGLQIAGYVQAGFPSPAEDNLVDTLSLDDYLIRKPEASFMLKVSGDSMIDAGIMPGDLVIIERGGNPKNNDVVLAQVDRNWTLKYFFKRKGEVVLVAANKNYPEIRAKEELSIAGVVTAVIRKYQ